MPDACDHIVDLQLKQFEIFGAERLRLLMQRTFLGLTADCIDCGDPIDPARLEAMPSACRCVVCQTITDRRG